MSAYHQEVILAMELNRSHIGKLVQIITDSWSMTGTLVRCSQHDNREWEIAYPSRQLVPSAGEIYTNLTIGPWTGDVIGNQPVTVETVRGTLEAPERARVTPLKRIQPGQIADLFDVPVEMLDPDVVKGSVVDDLPPEPVAEWSKAEDPVHWLVSYGRTACKRMVRPVLPGLRVTDDEDEITCPACLDATARH